MKNSYMTLMLCLFASMSLLAVSNTESNTLRDRMVEGSELIDLELSNLTMLNDAIVSDALSFNALAAEYPCLVAESNLSPVLAPSILSGHPDSPLGIPGFWWGVCCWWVGIIIVYLVMDEGSGRKEQVKNSVYGCLISAGFWIILNRFLGVLSSL